MQNQQKRIWKTKNVEKCCERRWKCKERGWWKDGKKWKFFPWFTATIFAKETYTVSPPFPISLNFERTNFKLEQTSNFERLIQFRLLLPLPSFLLTSNEQTSNEQTSNEQTSNEQISNTRSFIKFELIFSHLLPIPYLKGEGGLWFEPNIKNFTFWT